ncbi:hypothetical protein [Caproiciproducens galactitolivorans]|nr:hypothetical protein [Caproiciproducens galactitolivorans]
MQAGGKSKAEIVKKICQTKPTPLLSATVMQLVNNGVMVLDRDAASEIL